VARWAEGRFDRLPQLAAELVRLNVDVMVTAVTEASLAAKAATSTIPIVMAGVGDPVAVGLVASLARPGGNVTGTAGMSADLVGKQLELLKDIDPALSRVAVLWNPANAAFQALQVHEAETAARRTGMQLRFVEARDPSAFSDAFATIRREQVQALLILGDPVYRAHRDALAAHAMKQRLVAVSGTRAFVEAGGLAGYGPSFPDLSRRAATYVDKLLKGGKPADLPVEQPTRFELVVNLKTAKALGVTIPPTVLARADEVIE
jgi:putative ABC transport system substrate-binding protein